MIQITRRTSEKKACTLTSVAGLLAFVFFARDASAGGPLGPQGSRIQTSKYGVDLFQGPVLATSRITGLAGAFTAIAEGTDGIPFNPAAASMRAPYSTTRNDFDLTAGLTIPGSLPGAVNKADFYNNGSDGLQEKFVWLTFGGIIQHDHIGFGLIGSFQNYSLLPPATLAAKTLSMRIVRADPVISYGFAEDQLHIGAGLRFAGLYGAAELVDLSNEILLINSNTLGVQAGALWTPFNLPIRVGATVRSPVIPVSSDEGRVKPCQTSNASPAANERPFCVDPAVDDDRVLGNPKDVKALYVPEKLELPYEIEAGIAAQFWKRPFNIPWQDEDKVAEADSERWRRTVKGQQEPSWAGARRMLKARYRALPRERVLVSVSALLSGPVPNSVGIESMLSGKVDRSGESVVVTLRAGAEAEVIPNWLVVQLGSYLEPTRFAARRQVCGADETLPACPERQAGSRLHATSGISLRTIRWDVFGLMDEDTIFRVSTAVDFGFPTVGQSKVYFGYSIGAGLWW